jgi:hypothetical protein
MLYVIMLSITTKNKLLIGVIKLGLDRLIVIIPCAAMPRAIMLILH